jgi:hypothetical protein
MPAPIQFRRCPWCNGWVAANALNCSGCEGSESAFEYVNDLTADECGSASDAPEGLRPHRGLWVQLAGSACLLQLVPSLFAYSIANHASSIRDPLAAAAYWLLTGGMFLAGMGVGVAGVVIAFRDLKGMEGGRVDPDGRAKCVCGGILATVSLLAYWAVIGHWVYSQL